MAGLIVFLSEIGRFYDRVMNFLRVNPDNSVRPDGAFHQWRKDPPR
jgi:hypothetical protein